MASALSLFVVAGCAWSGVAYQQRIQEEGQLRTRGPSTMMTVLPQVEQGVRQELEKAGSNYSVYAGKVASTLYLGWSLIHAGPGFNASMSANPNWQCKTEYLGKRFCDVPVSQASNAHVDVVVGKPLSLYKTDKLEMVQNVNVNFVQKSEKTVCAVCGQACSGMFMGHQWSMEMPPCPLLGTWTVHFPLDQFGKVPMGFNTNLHTIVRQSDGSIALEYHTHIRT